MEGWNSWRVSNMGLLNIGRSEGSQIIQLFGRGVRLKGKELSLKRSAVLDGPHPKYISLLETLNICAVRANYMAQFREYLEREGVETEPVIELPLFTWINEPALRKELVIPRTPEGRSFVTEERLALGPSEDIKVRVDMSVRVQAMTSTTAGLHEVQAQVGLEQQIPAESLALVDWEQVYLELLDYKTRKGWHNLLIRPETPRQLMGQINYTLIADEAVVRPKSFAERELLQQAVSNVLHKYLDTFYRRRRERWETRAMEYRPLDENDPNLAFNLDRVSEGKPAYIVKVKRSDEDLVRAIQKLLEEAGRVYHEEDQELPRIHFDRHLYLPLLVQATDKLETIPPALNQSEAQFVRDLRDYWEAEKDDLLAGKEVYVLRNLTRGKGVGFFENRGFYPDFILWVLDRQSKGQRLVFVEPHGMRHVKAYIHDEKARLHERLPELAREIAKRSGLRNVTLDAFIISVTPYEELRSYYDDGTWDRKQFAERHILFQERGPDYDYISIILQGS